MRRFLFGTKNDPGDTGILDLLWYNICQLDWVIFTTAMLLGAILVGMGMLAGWFILNH